METKKSLVTTVLATATLLLMISCKKNDGVSANQPIPTNPQQIVIHNSATLGAYLTDNQNRALYFFSNDADGQDSCTGGCQLLWPVFNVDQLTADKLGPGLDFSDFGSITSVAGGKQITYKGWPLYSYAPPQNGINQPEAAGLTSGDGFAGVWYVAKPDYTIMLANAQLIGADTKNYRSDYSEGNGKTVYFTDGNGLTLYTFSKDSIGENKFTSADFSNNHLFPIYETDKIVIPSSLDKSDFLSIQVFGRTQLSYKGWPLYNFGADSTTRGSNKAVSVPRPGVWPVAVKNVPAAP